MRAVIGNWCPSIIVTQEERIRWPDDFVLRAEVGEIAARHGASP